jgi:hypothetical protein
MIYNVFKQSFFIDIPMKHSVVKALNGDLVHYKDAIEQSNNTFYSLSGQELIAHKGAKVAHHFAIKNHGVEADIHKEAKAAVEYLVNNKIKINIKCRRHEIDTITATAARQEDRIPYTDDRADVMLYNDDNSINCIIEIYNTHKTAEHKRVGYKWYELDANIVIKTLEEYCRYKHTEITFQCIRPYPIVYINQLGAGNGKTYMSVKLIENDERFKDINIFIYVTKVHSAKYAISDKFKEIFGDDENYIPNISSDGKKIYYSPLDKKIIICTIDYLYNCLTKETRVANDDGTHYINNNSVFDQIAEEISLNPLVSRTIPYISQMSDEDGNIQNITEPVELGDKTLLIVDEAQDLDLKYTKAYFNITKHCNMVCYAIGDKLQSLKCKDSIYQDSGIIQKLEEECGVYCVYNTPLNICRRFNHPDHMILVNDIVGTNIVGIGGNYTPKNGLKAVNVILTNITHNKKSIKYTDTDDDDDDDTDVDDVETSDTNIMDIAFYNDIIQRIELEVDTNIYTPRNFMFVLPIISKVDILEPLSARIREFWQRKLLDETYRNELALVGEEYWLNIEDTDKEVYSFIHKSEDGRPIDLDESVNQTRFLSIDAAKGNGCEVVFVLNFTHKNIKARAGCIMDINYMSFVHVALTRQKNSIYVYLNSNTDDLITNKFSNYTKDMVLSNDRHHRTSGRITIQPDRLNIKNFYNDSIKVDSIFADGKTKSLVDMNYHILRNYAIKTIMHIRCITNSKENDKDVDFCYIMGGIIIDNIVGVSPREYFDWLKTFDIKGVKIMENSKNAPLLFMILPIIKTAMRKLQRKIKYITYEKFCPLEYVMVSFVWNIIKFRQFSEFTCIDLYNIMKYYEDIATTDHNKEYECGCPSNKDNLECRNKITNFINEIDIISNIVAKVPSHKFEMTKPLFYKCGKKHVVINPMFVSYKICSVDPLSPYKKEYTIYLTQPTLDLITLPQVLIRAEIAKFMIRNCSDDKLKCIDNISVKVVTMSFNELIDLKRYEHCRFNDDKVKKEIERYINSLA